MNFQTVTNGDWVRVNSPELISGVKDDFNSLTNLFHSQVQGSVKIIYLLLCTLSTVLIVGDERSKRRGFKTSETWSKWAEEENWEDD